MVKRQMVLMIAMALVLVLGVAGAGKTAYWSLRFGLTPRPPLSMFETIPRYAAVITALFLAWARKDSMERSALICAVIAAGSSGLDGLGINSVTLQVVRLLFHFLAYSLGALAITRWFQGMRETIHESRRTCTNSS